MVPPACRLGAIGLIPFYRVIISTDETYCRFRVWPIPHLAHSAQKRRCTKTGAPPAYDLLWSLRWHYPNQVMGLSMNSLLSAHLSELPVVCINNTHYNSFWEKCNPFFHSSPGHALLRNGPVTDLQHGCKGCAVIIHIKLIPGMVQDPPDTEHAQTSVLFAGKELSPSL